MADRFGLQRPWYWDTFLAQVDSYHHLVYASAYTYRATVWFNMTLPSPAERRWLAEKYPSSWPQMEPVWEQIQRSWERADVGNEFAVHGTAIIGFCDLCQLVLCGGSTYRNSASTLSYQGRKYIFCSDPCRWIFLQEPQRYAPHRGLVARVLAGEAPANLIAMLRCYFGLSYATWGKDLMAGGYPWLQHVRANKTREERHEADAKAAG
jgi:toluene monooxygenase system protein A